MKDILYYEEQRFRQPWIWAVALPSLFLPMVLFWHRMYLVFILGENAFRIRMSPAELMVVTLGITLLCLTALAILFYFKMQTFVNPEKVIVKMFPFGNLRLPMADIDQAFFRAYSPVREYGGWGVRNTLSGDKAYNVYGKEGVQLVLRDGKRILLGSQRANELAEMMQNMLHKAHHGQTREVKG